MKSETRRAVGWLRSESAAEYLDFVYTADVIEDGQVVHRKGDPNLRALYDFIRKHKVRKHYAGASLRFRAVDLDRAIEASPDEQVEPLRGIAGGKR